MINASRKVIISLQGKDRAHFVKGIHAYCGVPGLPCLSITGLILARIFHFLVVFSL